MNGEEQYQNEMEGLADEQARYEAEQAEAEQWEAEQEARENEGAEAEAEANNPTP